MLVYCSVGFMLSCIFFYFCICQHHDPARKLEELCKNGLKCPETSCLFRADENAVLTVCHNRCRNLCSASAWHFCSSEKCAVCQSSLSSNIFYWSCRWLDGWKTIYILLLILSGRHRMGVEAEACFAGLWCMSCDWSSTCCLVFVAWLSLFLSAGSQRTSRWQGKCNPAASPSKSTLISNTSAVSGLLTS